MSDRLANITCFETEAQVFAGDSLQPRPRQFQLQKPPLLLRAIEVGAGKPALFLHGFSLCTAHWAPLISRVPPLRSVAIDMPGHGGSGAVDYSGVDLRNWFKEMLTSCLDDLGFASAHIIGHSQGAMIGLWLALDLPDRVRSLVAIGTPAVAFGAHLEQFRMLARPGIGPFLTSIPARVPQSMFGRMIAANMGRHAVATAPELVRAAHLAQRRPGFGKTVSTYLRPGSTGWSLVRSRSPHSFQAIEATTDRRSRKRHDSNRTERFSRFALSARLRCAPWDRPPGRSPPPGPGLLAPLGTGAEASSLTCSRPGRY